MTPDPSELINGYLDGSLSAEQEVYLNEWIASDPDNAKVFVREVYLHDALRNLSVSNQELNPTEFLQAGNETEIFIEKQERSPIFHFKRRTLLSFCGSLAALFLLVLGWVAWGHLPKASAASELNFLIESSAASQDRTYIIRSLDREPAPTEPRQPPIDGARLFIRAPDKYVLIRYFPDGRPYVTGFDGERNWDVPPSAPVRLSRDPLRFRWPLPGHQHSIPFADLRSDLTELRDAYLLSTLQQDPQGWHGLLAVKKSSDYRGPKQVEIWYDRSTRVIRKMVFRGLPMARGGPRSLVVELAEEKDLDLNFFLHQSHHTPDRRVIEED